MKNFLITLLMLLTSQTLPVFAGGSATSSQDQLLFLIPILLLALLWGSPKVYSFLKTKFKKQIPEEEKQE